MKSSPACGNPSDFYREGDFLEDSLMYLGEIQMPFSKEWEKKQYSRGRQINMYPFSNLVSLVMKYAKPQKFRYVPTVLELGCGTGPNIPLFLDKNFKYYGIEGSKTAVAIIKKRFREDIQIYNCDFTKRLPFSDRSFDLVVDRSSTTHNVKKDIINVIKECHRILKDKGAMIITDWFSVRESLSKFGEPIEKNTKAKYSTGQFKDMGAVHFFDKKEIMQLFSNGWEIKYLAHKVTSEIVPGPRHLTAIYDVVVIKK